LDKSMIRDAEGPRELTMANRISACETAEIAWADAMTWGSRNRVKLGGSEDEDLAAVNAARKRLGLPTFKIIMQRGRLARLPAPHVSAAEGD
jgi:hypothetical protein